MKFILYVSFILTSLFGGFEASAAVSNQEMYLSYGEKVLGSYALLAFQKTDAEKADILRRAAKFAAESAMVPIKTLEVKNFSEFLAHFRGELPWSGNLNLDLEQIEKMPRRGFVKYQAQSPRVQREIDEYLFKHINLLKNLQFNPEKAASISEDFILNQMEKFDQVGEKVSNSGISGVKNPAHRIVLQTLFSEYFGRLSLESKKYIMLAFLDGNLNMSEEQKLEAMIQKSGPQFQKLLQVVARQGGLPAEYMSLFKKLESAVSPVPWWMVEQILSKEAENFKFVYFEKKPLGVGTMAQAHRAKIIWGNQRQDVVVRFIKPDIEKRVNEDHKILVEVARLIDQNQEYRSGGGPLMSPLVEGITETVLAELDQNATLKRQIRAFDSYSAKSFFSDSDYKNVIHFHVPKIFTSKNPSRLMVQELLIGQSLDKEAEAYKKVIPNLKKGIVEAMARLWAKEIIFGKGFYHSDLHQGNFLVRVTDEAIHVNILDFGMGGHLSEQMQKKFMLIGAATALKQVDLMVQSFWDVSEAEKNLISKEEFKIRIQKKIQELASDNSNMGIERWTGWVSDQGIKLPYDLINLSRGMLIINNALAEVGSQETVASIEKQLAIRSPLKTISSLAGARRNFSNKNNSKANIRCEALF